jgi:hypothetical protein
MRYELTDLNGPLLFAQLTESHASAIFNLPLYSQLVPPTHDFVSKARRYSTYPPSIQSELFYTDSEKFSAQGYRVSGALSRFPPSPEALGACVCMRARTRE